MHLKFRMSQRGRKKIFQLIEFIDFLLSAASVNDQLS